MKNVVILGSTGSIGNNTLNVIRLNMDRYRVVALSANCNGQKLLEQCIEFNPMYALILEQKEAEWLKQKLQSRHIKTEVLNSYDDLNKIVVLDEVDIVMSAIVGSRGLMPTYKAILANKKV